MVWNNNPQNLDDNISNYNHELSKYKSEFAKVSAEFKKDDNITVNSFMAVRPGIEELKRTRKRFASGGSLSALLIIYNFGYSKGTNLPCYSVILPISFNPTTVLITFSVKDRIYSVFQNKETNRYQVAYSGQIRNEGYKIWNLTYINGYFTGAVNNIPDTARNKSNNTPISATFNTKNPIFYIDGEHIGYDEHSRHHDPPEIISWFATE